MKVLLVEDHPDLAVAITEALTMAGHTVRLEATMRGAMDALYEGGFDCVVADGRFPAHEMAHSAQDWGIDVLRAAKRANVRGILYSGDDRLVTQAWCEGFLALLKRASMAELLKAVEGA